MVFVQKWNQNGSNMTENDVCIFDWYENYTHILHKCCPFTSLWLALCSMRDQRLFDIVWNSSFFCAFSPLSLAALFSCLLTSIRVNKEKRDEWENQQSEPLHTQNTHVFWGLKCHNVSKWVHDIETILLANMSGWNHPYNARYSLVEWVENNKKRVSFCLISSCWPLIRLKSKYVSECLWCDKHSVLEWIYALEGWV